MSARLILCSPGLCLGLCLGLGAARAEPPTEEAPGLAPAAIAPPTAGEADAEKSKRAQTGDGSTPGVFGALHIGMLPFASPRLRNPVALAQVQDRMGRWVSAGEDARVAAGAEEISALLNFGLSLGYFPELLTVRPTADLAIAGGVVFRGGATWRDGWGGDVAFGPELAARYQRWRFSVGYTGSVSVFRQVVGQLSLPEGVDRIVVEDKKGPFRDGDRPCNSQEFRDGTFPCHAYSAGDDLELVSTFFAHGPHVRLGYSFVGLLAGYRFAPTQQDFQLVNRAEQEASVRGPDLSRLGAETDLSGWFVALEVFNQPF